jgi:hypothetical protein
VTVTVTYAFYAFYAWWIPVVNGMLSAGPGNAASSNISRSSHQWNLDMLNIWQVWARHTCRAMAYRPRLREVKPPRIERIERLGTYEGGSTLSHGQVGYGVFILA